MDRAEGSWAVDHGEQANVGLTKGGQAEGPADLQIAPPGAGALIGEV